MKKGTRIIAVVAFLVLAASAALAQTCEYQTEWGVLTIINTGSQVTGSYPHNNGHITGYMQNGVIQGTWHQHDGSGNFYFSLYQGGFNGSWNYMGDSGWRGGWNGRVIRCY